MFFYPDDSEIHSNLAMRNFLVDLKLFLNAKSSLSLWSKLAFGHRKRFLNTNLNTNLFRIKTFLITKFDCIRISKAYMWLCSGMEWSLTAKLVNVKSFICATESPQNFQKIEGLLKNFFFQNQSWKSMATEIFEALRLCLVLMMIDASYRFLEQNILLMKLIPTKVMNWNVPGKQTGHWNL